MCQPCVFWHCCDHLVYMKVPCYFKNIRHAEGLTTFAIVGTPCLLCQQPKSQYITTLKDNQMTASTLAWILDVSGENENEKEKVNGFLDKMVRFYARGDHIRFFQPASMGAAYYNVDDPYLAFLEQKCRQTRTVTRYDPIYNLPMFETYYEFDQDWAQLNWDRYNVHPTSRNFYVDWTDNSVNPAPGLDNVNPNPNARRRDRRPSIQIRSRSNVRSRASGSSSNPRGNHRVINSLPQLIFYRSDFRGNRSKLVPVGTPLDPGQPRVDDRGR